MRSVAGKAILVFFALFALAACGGGSGGVGGEVRSDNIPSASPYVYSVPESQNDGWSVGHLADHGFDPERVTAMIDEIVQRSIVGIDSISIVRNGTLLVSENFRTQLDQYDSWVQNEDLERHVLHSTSKSFTSALVGIAIEQGYISDTDALFYEFFSYVSYANQDMRKATLSLEDALTMRFGMRWDEWSQSYGSDGNSLTYLTENNDDYSKALLDLPMEGNPGETFVYNTAGSIAIGQALENRVGVPLADFAEMYLFAPLQISGAVWGNTPTGLPNGGSGLFLTTREMAKFGQLYIDDGKWQGEPVISSSWVRRSIQRHVELNWSDTSGYGYQWWLDRFSVDGQLLESYSTRGYGGQYIFCVPSLRLVVAFTAHNYGDEPAIIPFDLMRTSILLALDQS